MARKVGRKVARKVVRRKMGHKVERKVGCKVARQGLDASADARQQSCKDSARHIHDISIRNSLGDIRQRFNSF